MMFRSIVAVSLACAAGAVLGSGNRPEPAASVPDVRWEKDLAKATARAERTGRPMLVVFRCPP